MVESIRGTGPIGKPDDSGRADPTLAMQALPSRLSEPAKAGHYNSVKGYGFPEVLQKAFVWVSAQILSKLKI